MLLAGNRGRPVKLRDHIDAVAAAFRRREARDLPPWSISGLWKADLFVGTRDADRWVDASVKINREHLERARGLRIGIVPSCQGASDQIVKDDALNLVICPLPHDQAFMEVFSSQQYLNASVPSSPPASSVAGFPSGSGWK